MSLRMTLEGYWIKYFLKTDLAEISHLIEQGPINKEWLEQRGALVAENAKVWHSVHVFPS